MRPHVLSEPDTLVDLAVTLEELEDGLVALGAHAGGVVLEEVVEPPLFEGDVLLEGLLFEGVRGRCVEGLERVQLVELELHDPGVEEHTLGVEVFTLRIY
jgi:hypothetical protein